MFESIEFKDFKALRDTTLPLSRFTLIVGPNGSGKSTALQAFSALRNPNQSQFRNPRSADASSSLPVSVVARWKEEGNDYLVEVHWMNSRPNGPKYTPADQNPLPYEIRPRTALDRTRLFSLDAVAAAAPVL